eukprot:TRINITY_DN888_c0_g2_i2.p2 TRINITY_DN888_c0_g2~~TRINITY_DN888_c0_g2_i2.p2  ORF type:complete len:255 (-),score=42.71 TRINITY_DN888_c0_g2_i2:712-1476(-)
MKSSYIYRKRKTQADILERDTMKMNDRASGQPPTASVSDNAPPSPPRTHHELALDIVVHRRVLEVRAAADDDDDSSVHEQCVICLQKTEFLQFEGMMHMLCVSCFGRYLKSRIEQAEIVTCPHCERPVPEDVVKANTESAIFEKYKRFEQEREISADPRLRYCPNAQCSKLIVIEISKEVDVVCEHCKTMFCSACNHQSHKGETCNQKLERELTGWIDTNLVQMCKICRSLIQKVEGCDHITCKQSPALCCSYT